jgi:hypothetical protein
VPLPRISRNQALTVLCGLLLIVAACVSTYQYIKTPFSLGWDAMPYLGIIEQAPDRSPQQVHDLVYEEVREHVRTSSYRDLIGDKAWYASVHLPTETHWGDVHYRHVNAEDAEAFRQQFPFYAPRVGFLYFVKLLHLTGMDWVQAFRLSALIPSLLLLWTATLWAVFKIRAPVNLGIAALWWILSPLQYIVYMSNPDAACTFLAGVGCCLLLSRRMLLWGFAFICFGTVMRPDSVLVAMPAFAAALYLHRGLARNQIWALSAMLFADVAYVAVVQKTGHPYPIQTLWYHSLIQRMPYPSQGHVGISFMRYLEALQFSSSDLYYGYRPEWLGGLGLLYAAYRYPAYRPATVPFLIIAASCIGHLLIFPHFEDRYFALVPVSMLISLATAARIWHAQRNQNSPRGILIQTPSP